MTAEQFEQLRAEKSTFKKVCNGLGPDEYRKIIDALVRVLFHDGKGDEALFFWPACLHDVRTVRGGTEADRVESERLFFRDCIHWIAEQKLRYRVKYYRAAAFCRLMLWWKGKKFWNYRSAPIPWKPFIRIVRKAENEKECTKACYAYPDIMSV